MAGPRLPTERRKTNSTTTWEENYNKKNASTGRGSFSCKTLYMLSLFPLLIFSLKNMATLKHLKLLSFAFFPAIVAIKCGWQKLVPTRCLNSATPHKTRGPTPSFRIKTRLSLFPTMPPRRRNAKTLLGTWAELFQVFTVISIWPWPADSVTALLSGLSRPLNNRNCVFLLYKTHFMLSGTTLQDSCGGRTPGYLRIISFILSFCSLFSSLERKLFCPLAEHPFPSARSWQGSPTLARWTPQWQATSSLLSFQEAHLDLTFLKNNTLNEAVTAFSIIRLV